METAQDLQRQLTAIDGRGYPAYKQLRDVYRVGPCSLSIDHVQGDPFAAPSKVSVRVSLDEAGIAPDLFDEAWRRVALEDFLVRRFARALAAKSHRVGGSGKSGFLGTSRPGPEVVRRSACDVTSDGVTMRFEAGFPAHGRRVDARALERMLLDLVPSCVDEALVLDAEALAQARAAVDLADDQHAVREALDDHGLIAFVADGAILPRESGVSSHPLRNAKSFSSPESLCIALDLPHRGRTTGMGVRRGVTLVVGGGYHGKSTLLRAVQEGVYNHVAGDGRELVITDASAVKLRAEDGRAVHEVDISLFIGDLPDGRSTQRFTTSDASGSTSQAAAAAEALCSGCRVFLIDEDTSATNFMVRDRLMEAVVSRAHEPITPFVERVRDLWEQAHVSSMIVAGSSGSFFSVADTVLQMDCYEARDITEHARAVCRHVEAPDTPRAPGFTVPDRARVPEWCAFAPASSRDHRAPRGRGGRGAHETRVKVRVQGLDSLQVGTGSCDVRLVEQLVDSEQTAALARLMRTAQQRGLLDGAHEVTAVVDELFSLLAREGWAALDERGSVACGLALPRPVELAAVMNRWRS